MNKNWKLAGAAMLLAVALPVTAYAADNLGGKSQEDQKKASYADARKTTPAGKQGEKPGAERSKKLNLDLQAIALSKLGMDQAAFEQARQAGQSLADVAKEQGKALQPLIDALAKEIGDEILAHLEPKDLTAEEKANVEKKAAMEAERIFSEPLNQESEKQKGSEWNLAKALALIGIDKAAFAEQVQAGKKLVDIAKDRGVTREQLLDALLSDVNAKLDDAKAKGEITQEQADEKKQAILREAEAFVDRTPTLFQKKDSVEVAKDKKGNAKEEGIGGFDLQAAFELLGIDKAAFAEQVQAGKSFADIAQDHGVSREQLIATLMSDFASKIDSVLADGEITQAQADQKKQAVQKEVEDFVDHTQTRFEKKEAK